MITWVYQMLQMNLPTETARPRLIDEISGGLGWHHHHGALFVLGTEGPKEMGDDMGHETDDVDGSCFVSKSPAGNKLGWHGCAVASRVPPHDFSSSTYLFSLFFFILRPFLLSPFHSPSPKDLRQVNCSAGPHPSPQGLFARTQSTAIPHSPIPTTTGSHQMRK